MTQQPDIRAQAKQLCDAQNYEEAGRLYHRLWDEQGDAFSGGRYAYCLRKAGYARAALTVAREVHRKHPDDIYVRREVVWALYEAEFKPAKEKGDLGTLVRVGRQIMDLTDEELPVRLVSFAVIGLAKDKMKWGMVSAWCDRLDQQKLSTEPREMGGRRVISEREQWYFAKVKSLVQLKQWDEARELAMEAMEVFPRNRHFARWAAQSLAGQGDLHEAIAELEALLERGQPEWYLLYNLAELRSRNGQNEEALTIACRAALAPGEDKAKVGLYVFIGQMALALGQFEMAARHATLSRLVRRREGWSVPQEVTHLEAEVRSAAGQADDAQLDMLEDITALAAHCRQDWERLVPLELRPRPRSKRRKRPPSPVVGADQPFHTGRIKTYLEGRGFGFIVPDDGGDDLFFHITNVVGIEQPGRGMVVEYQVIETPKGLNAVNVQLAQSEQ